MHVMFAKNAQMKKKRLRETKNGYSINTKSAKAYNGTVVKRALASLP